MSSGRGLLNPANIARDKLSICSDSYIVIDRNVPIPDAAPKGKYPWDKMEVGDSFVFPGTLDPHACYAAAQNIRKKCPDKDFRVRRIGKQYRCWRVK